MITLDSIDYSLHSIQIKDAAGDALAIGADGSLNVTDNGGSLTVDAVNLDIRDLAFATDKVDVTGSEVSLDSGTLAALESITVQNGAGAAAVNIQDGGNSITVDGTVSISGNVTVDQGTSPWVVGDGGGSLTVDAVDLDIRDLSHSQDSVKIGDGTDFLAVNADGSINVQSFEGAYSSWTVVAASVDDTVGGTQLAASPLSGRLRVEIQNLGTQDIYIRQSTGVTTSNGLKIPKGSSYEQALDAGAAIYAITPSGSSDVRIAQYAA